MRKRIFSVMFFALCVIQNSIVSADITNSSSKIAEEVDWKKADKWIDGQYEKMVQRAHSAKESTLSFIGQVGVVLAYPFKKLGKLAGLVLDSARSIINKIGAQKYVKNTLDGAALAYSNVLRKFDIDPVKLGFWGGGVSHVTTGAVAMAALDSAGKAGLLGAAFLGTATALPVAVAVGFSLYFIAQSALDRANELLKDRAPEEEIKRAQKTAIEAATLLEITTKEMQATEQQPIHRPQTQEEMREELSGIAQEVHSLMKTK